MPRMLLDDGTSSQRGMGTQIVAEDKIPIMAVLRKSKGPILFKRLFVLLWAVAFSVDLTTTGGNNDVCA